MPEDAGKLEVEYIVVSDAAMRRLERLQKQFEKVEKAANKQAKSIDKSFKGVTKTIAALGAVAVASLYGIIKASSYAAMWTDQLGHSMTRLANVILEKTGAKEALDFIVESFSKFVTLCEDFNIDNTIKFVKDLASGFMDLDTKAKAAYLAILAIAGILGVISLTALIDGLKLLAVWFGRTWLGAKVLALGAAGLKLALAGVAAAGGWVVIAIAALILFLGYLWSKTDHGKAQIEALSNAWNNFKDNISDDGWISAIGTLMGDLGHIVLHEFSHMLKEVWHLQTDWFFDMIDTWWESGKKIIKWFIEGIDEYIPGFKTKIYEMYNNAVEVWNLMVTLAYNKASEMLNSFVDGIDDKIPGFRAAWDRVATVFGYKSDEMVVEANDKSKAMGNKFIENANSTAVAIWDPWANVGNAISGGLADGVAGMHEPVCREMTNAEKCAQLGMVAIDEIFDESLDSAANYHTRMLAIFSDTQQAAWDAASDVEKAEYLGGGDSDDGGSSGGGGSSGWAFSGWANSPGFDASATGGHVLRTGPVTVHQGEDIVHLKSLLAGIRPGDNGATGGRGDIIINPTINIESNGKMSDPFEANRVADVISKRMGEELRRITTNI